MLSLADMDSNECVDEKMFGYAEEVSEEKVGDGDRLTGFSRYNLGGFAFVRYGLVMNVSKVSHYGV